MLEGDVEIRQHLALGHQPDDLIDMRVGVDILQPHPGAEFAEFFCEVKEFGANLAILPRAVGIFDIDAVGRGVLRDDEQFLDAGTDQPFRLAQHVIGRARHQIAAQLRDDAEAAAVVAAFGNLQVSVVPRSQLDALRRHQIEMRIVQRRHRAVHGLQHAFILLRPRDRQHAGIGGLDLFGFGAHAAGHDHLAIRGHGLADGAERFLFGAVEEATGVDDDEIGAVMLARQLVAFGAQPGDNTLGIHQRLGAPQGNKADFGRGGLLHAESA